MFSERPPAAPRWRSEVNAGLHPERDGGKRPVAATDRALRPRPGLTWAMTPIEGRFQRFATRRVAGVEVPVAERFAARALGLAFLDRGEAGAGLLIPRCRCVHTFGMRFALDIVFLDPAGQVIRRAQAVPSRRIVLEWGAAAVLELPSV
jgi:uncharacterized protein